MWLILKHEQKGNGRHESRDIGIEIVPLKATYNIIISNIFLCIDFDLGIQFNFFFILSYNSKVKSSLHKQV